MKKELDKPILTSIHNVDRVDIEDKVIDMTEVIKPRLAFDNTTGAGNWLEELEVDTVFCVEDKHNRSFYIAPMFKVLHKAINPVTNKVQTVGLFSHETKSFHRVIPSRFTQQFSFLHIVAEETEEEPNE